MKVVLLIGYSEKKIIFRKIRLNSYLQNRLWKLKMSNVWQSLIKRPHKKSKNPLRRLIQMQKSIEFYLHHWEIPQLSPYYSGLSRFPAHIQFLLWPILTHQGVYLLDTELWTEYPIMPTMQERGNTRTGLPIKIKPYRNSYTEGCVKMRALQQYTKLFIVNLSLFWSTVW